MTVLLLLLLLLLLWHMNRGASQLRPFGHFRSVPPPQVMKLGLKLFFAPKMVITAGVITAAHKVVKARHTLTAAPLHAVELGVHH